MLLFVSWFYVTSGSFGQKVVRDTRRKSQGSRSQNRETGGDGTATGLVSGKGYKHKTYNGKYFYCSFRCVIRKNDCIIIGKDVMKY